MSVSVLILACLMAILVAGQNEWEEFDFQFEESLLFQESSGSVYTLPLATVTVFTNDSVVFPKSPKADSDPVPEPEPEPEPAVNNSRTAAIHASDTKTSRPYSFGYAVEDNTTGLDFGHTETSDGLVVTGTYYVLLPDGRKQTVNYKADDKGYVAEVSYEGEAKLDDAQALPAKGGASGTLGKLQVDTGSSKPAPGVGTTAEPPRFALTSKSQPLVAGHQVPTAQTGSKVPAPEKTINLSSTASSGDSVASAALTSVPFPTTTPIPHTSISGITTMTIPAAATTPRPGATATSPSTSFTVTPISTTPPSVVTNPSTISILAQNLTTGPQSQSLGTRPTGTTTFSTPSPDSFLTPTTVPEGPESSSSQTTFSGALAAFVRSSGPTFTYCRKLLPNCTTTSRPSRSSSKTERLTRPVIRQPCSYCISLRKTCSKLESADPEDISSIRNDTYQAFQALIPLAPTWPPTASPIAELARTIKNTPSSGKVETSNNSNLTITALPSNRSSDSIDFSDAQDEFPADLADITEYAEIHFSYCRRIKPFCTRLESTRPYWEGSSEVPRKWKESFLSTIHSCSYCRSLWPLCSDLETSEFLLDPAQLFTLHSLEQDVTDAVFTISYCRNMTEDCAKLNTTKSLQKFPSQTPARPVPVATADPVPAQTSFSAEKPTPAASAKVPQPLNSEEDSKGIQLVIYCRRLSSICSPLLSM